MKLLIALIFIMNILFGNENPVNQEIMNDKYSLLKKENNVYFKYIEDLILHKKISKEEIKELLNSKERTVKSNLLKALDYDFNKNNINEAQKYYDEIIIKVSNKIKNTTEAIYISDYLVRRGKYDIINQLLTIDYCESLFDKDKEGKCLYYLYFANKNKVLNKEESLLKNKYPKLWEIIEK